MIRVENVAATRLKVADFAMSGLASALAAYATGMALGLPLVGLVFVVGVVIGTVFSYFVQRALPRPGVWEGFLYAFLAISAAYLARRLNVLLPEEGFPPELMVAGVLSWMLLFGSFAAWRDSYLLFQAVPSIALFGMVGAWDTFGGSAVTFFAFLMCIATFFARVHARAMLRQAMASGYDVSEIHAGPWRWMAGPEWALVSAAAIILISLVGAPILQESVKGVSEAIKVRVPLPPAIRRNLSGISQRPGTEVIGTGPVTLSDREALLVKMDRPRYLRAQVFDVFNGRSWTNSHVAAIRGLLSDNDALPEKAVLSMKDSKEIEFEVELLRPLPFLPVPGEVVSIEVQQGMNRLRDGTFVIEAPGVTKVAGTSQVAPESARGEHANNDISLGWYSRAMDPEVIKLTRDVTAGANNDWEKAMAIKQEIERRCTYNLNAAAVPPGENAIAFFLFDSREGYCDLFASSMAVMAMAADLPSRYVTGYGTFRREKRDGKYILTDAEAHAWCEIFFEGLGWVVFDATEGAAFAPGSERGSTNAPTPWYLAWTFLIPSAAVLAGGGTLLFVRIRRRLATSKSVLPESLARRQIAALYLRFERMLERRARKPRRPSQTVQEYLDVISPRLGPAEEEARRLGDRFVQTLYGHGAIESGLLGQIKEQLALVKRSLKKARRAQG